LFTFADLLECREGFTFLGLARFKEGGDNFRPAKMAIVGGQELA
jgi:hypothetical protein